VLPRGLLAVLLLCMAVGPATAQAQGPAALPFVPAQPARAFGESVGVNVHLLFEDTSYGRFDVVRSRLRELGVRYVRDGLCATCVNQVERLRALAAVGIRTHLIAGKVYANQGAMVIELQANLNKIRERLRGSVVSVGAPNEPDLQGVSEWIARTRTFQRELWLRVKLNPALSHLSVVGPAVVNHANRPALGDLSAYLDHGNMHPYPGGGTPLHNLEAERWLAFPISRRKPLVATEAGYHSDLTTTSGHNPASERAIAMYTPRLVLEGFRGGVVRTFIYQLADPWPRGRQPAHVPPFENSFGLLRGDLSPKPAFLALRNLLRAVDASSAPVANPGGLRFGLEGAPPDLRRLLLRSADGSYALVLWREVSVWDWAARRDLFPSAHRLEVVLGEPVALGQRFDPVQSAAETGRWILPQRIPVDLAGAPVVLRLTPPSPVGTGDPGTAQVLRISTRRRQRLRKRIRINVWCASPCAKVGGRGTLTIGRTKKRRFRLKAVTKKAGDGVLTLSLRIPARARRVARRALKKGRRVRARLKVTARSASGERLAVVRRTVVLRR
jgi:hypothetical protein